MQEVQNQRENERKNIKEKIKESVRNIERKESYFCKKRFQIHKRKKKIKLMTGNTNRLIKQIKEHIVDIFMCIMRKSSF